MPNTHNTLGSLFSDIADAIRAKDGTSAEIVADTFPDRIEAIDTDPSGDATAVASDILYSKTAYSQGQKLIGTMPNNGATGGTITTQNGTYTIPAGYTSGGTVTATLPSGTITNSIIESCVMNPTAASGDEDTARVTVTVPTGYHTQTTVTKDFEDLLPGLDTGAANAQILDGYQAYDDHGNQLTGVMTNNGAVSPTISTQGGTYTIPQGYHSGSGVVTASINNVTGSIGGSASAGSATAAIANTDSMRTVASPSGTAGTDYFRVKATATGSNGSYTPKYTVTTGGYIGSDVTGTAQTVSVSSDTTGQTINIPKATFTVDGAAVKTTSTGGGYVKDSATVGTVASGSATTPATTVSPSVSSVSFAYNSTNGNFDVTGSGSTTKSVTPTVSPGYVSSGTAGTITGSASVAATAPKIAGSVSISGTKMYTPSISRTAKPSGDTWTDAASGAATTTKPTSGVYVQVNSAKNSGNVSAGATVSTAGYGTAANHGISGSGNVEVGANASSDTYIPITTLTLPTAAAASADGTNKATIGRSTSDQYINIPVGYNSAKGSYKISAVANGSATGPSSLSGSSATVTTGTNTITLTKTGVTTTPTVSPGYVSSATASTATVALTASVTTKAAATITPGTTNQTIAAGTYLTGAQTISGDADLVAGNSKKNVNIFGVVGSYEGTSTSDATATAADIVSGKTAYISTGKVTGTLAIYDGTVIVNS